MSNFKHPFHIVNNSPWPITGALAALFITSGITKWFHASRINLIILGIFTIILITFQWWRDVSRERAQQGHHTINVIIRIRWGIILFILSEVIFFLSFFWAFFHSRLSPTPEIGTKWPPTGIIAFNPIIIPLLNTTVLLTSGITVTWAHHSILENNLTQTKSAIIITIILGIYFTALQAIEYVEAPFTISDSVYGTTFFVATGFHGLHVIIGTTFLIVSTLRIWALKISAKHHFGFEASAWYWHFVDVVWLFLYSIIYWWASYFLSINSTFNFQLNSKKKIIIIIYFVIVLIITIILPIVSYLIYFKNINDKEKNSPFECGFEPAKTARKGFSLKFFILAVLFLIFDVEIALIIPAPLTINTQMLIYKIIIFIIFILLLILGLIYEWKNGILNWTK